MTFTEVLWDGMNHSCSISVGLVTLPFLHASNTFIHQVDHYSSYTRIMGATLLIEWPQLGVIQDILMKNFENSFLTTTLFSLCPNSLREQWKNKKTRIERPAVTGSRVQGWEQNTGRDHRSHTDLKMGLEAAGFGSLLGLPAGTMQTEAITENEERRSDGQIY